MTPSALVDQVLQEIAVDITKRSARAVIRGHEIEQESAVLLKPVLGSAIYQLLHCGRDELTGAPDRTADPHLVKALRSQVRDGTTPIPGVLVDTPALGAEFSAVRLDGVTVAVANDRLESRASTSTAGSVTVRVPRIRESLSPGFLVVDGCAGSIHTKDDIHRIYLRIESATLAPPIWGRVLTELDQNYASRFRAKVLTRSDEYPRNDALVVYLPHLDETLLRAVAALPLGSDTGGSAFCRPLAAGVGYAREPAGLASRGISFGQHRSQVIADTLVDHHTDTTVPLRQALSDALIAADIDPAAPWQGHGAR
ncbi:T3SS effector HopA1 family protein [Rhodococcoides corynebacterioides]|uniref:T3SS effector HopA1 family protein n=1 Tax=Rhodococcoides corynebacterioides TaxID=53972 RepID=UPI003F818D73